MAKTKPESQKDVVNESSGTTVENIPVVTREELRQAKREAKAAKQRAAEQAVVSDDKNKKATQKTNSANVKTKPKLGQRIAKVFKEMISELKKVSWPTWKTVVKSTTVVIIVVLFFLIILTGMDFGLGLLLKLLTKSAGA